MILIVLRGDINRFAIYIRTRSTECVPAQSHVDCAWDSRRQITNEDIATRANERKSNNLALRVPETMFFHYV